MYLEQAISNVPSAARAGEHRRANDQPRFEAAISFEGSGPALRQPYALTQQGPPWKPSYCKEDGLYNVYYSTQGSPSDTVELLSSPFANAGGYSSSAQSPLLMSAPMPQHLGPPTAQLDSPLLVSHAPDMLHWPAQAMHRVFRGPPLASQMTQPAFAPTSGVPSPCPTLSSPDAASPSTAADPLRYNDAEELVAPPPTMNGRTSHSHRVPKGYIKRPPNGFLRFRSRFLEQNSALPVDHPARLEESRAISRAAGLVWRRLPGEQRQRWNDQAKVAMFAWKAQHPELSQVAHSKKASKARARNGKSRPPKRQKMTRAHAAIDGDAAERAALAALPLMVEYTDASLRFPCQPGDSAEPALRGDACCPNPGSQQPQPPSWMGAAPQCSCPAHMGFVGYGPSDMPADLVPTAGCWGA